MKHRVPHPSAALSRKGGRPRSVCSYRVLLPCPGALFAISNPATSISLLSVAIEGNRSWTTVAAYRVFERELEAVRLSYGFVVSGYVSDARACSSSSGRAAGFVLVDRVAGTQTEHLTATKATGGRALLAKALLRFQCSLRVQATGKVTLHAQQSGAERAGDETGRLALVELRALCDG